MEICVGACLKSILGAEYLVDNFRKIKVRIGVAWTKECAEGNRYILERSEQKTFNPLGPYIFHTNGVQASWRYAYEDSVRPFIKIQFKLIWDPLAILVINTNQLTSTLPRIL